MAVLHSDEEFLRGIYKKAEEQKTKEWMKPKMASHKYLKIVPAAASVLLIASLGWSANKNAQTPQVVSDEASIPEVARTYAATSSYLKGEILFEESKETYTELTVRVDGIYEYESTDILGSVIRVIIMNEIYETLDPLNPGDDILVQVWDYGKEEEIELGTASQIYYPAEGDTNQYENCFGETVSLTE